MMTNIFVVVADSSRARILSAKKPADPLAEVTTLEHPEARLHERELTSDLPGRAFDSGGQGRHAMGSTVEPKQQESIRFAKEVSDYLEGVRNNGGIDKLYVVSAPAFLGQLREQFSKPLGDKISKTLNKNLVGHDLTDIRAALPQYL